MCSTWAATMPGSSGIGSSPYPTIAQSLAPTSAPVARHGFLQASVGLPVHAGSLDREPGRLIEILVELGALVRPVGGEAVKGPTQTTVADRPQQRPDGVGSLGELPAQVGQLLAQVHQALIVDDETVTHVSSIARY